MVDGATKERGESFFDNGGGVCQLVVMTADSSRDSMGGAEWPTGGVKSPTGGVEG